MFALRYHGNYVGPGWSAGKYQPSVADSDVPAVDEFDRTAKEHDRAYARKENLKEADYRFYRANIGWGWKRSAAAMAVVLQGFLRKPQPFLKTKKQKNMPAMPTPPNSRPRGRSMARSGSRSRSRSLRTRSVSMARSSGPRSMSVSRRSARSARSGGSLFSRSTAAAAGGARANNFSGKFKKGSKKATKRQKLERVGVTYISEYGNELIGAQQTILGHTNFAAQRVLRLIMGSMLKKMLDILNHHFVSLDEPVGTSHFAANDQFVLWAKYDENSTASVAFSVAIALGDTWNGLINQMVTKYNLWVDARNEEGITPQLLNFRYEPLSGTLYPKTTLNMQNARVKLYLKSDLKIQNRTVSVTADNEADDVNNVPIQGKVFDGNGTGAVWAHTSQFYGAPADFRLLGDVGTGLITNPGSFLSTGGEPLTKKNYKYVFTEGNVRMAPGEIKTSTLIYERSHAVDVILKNLVPINTGNTVNANPRLYFGKFRFMQFDRMIDVGATQSNLILGYEINNYTNASLTLGRSKSIMPKYERL